MRQIEIIYSSNIMDLQNKVNHTISQDNDDVIDVKLSVGLFGYYCVVMKEIDEY